LQKNEIVSSPKVFGDSKICLGQNNFALGYNLRKMPAAFFDKFAIGLGDSATRIQGAVLKQIHPIERSQL
jgi:hypothetical protein